MSDAREWLARARAGGTPVLDGDRATFLWRGARPPGLRGDFQDWAPAPIALKPVGPRLWACTVKLPRDAYVEYGFFDRRGRRVVDPLNPRAVSNGMGASNHFFHMPEAGPTPLARPGRDVPRGTLTRHLLDTEEWAVGRRRAVSLYAPPTEEPCPLLVVLDGPDYLRRARLATLVDNLLAQGRIRPIAMAFVANGGSARTPEYACSEATLHFLLRKVLPLAARELRLIDVRRHPGVHGVLGASLGGLMALYAALRAPDIFGQVLSQSGAFAVEGHDFVVFELARTPVRRPLKVWMDCGGFEEQLLEGNRRMQPLLAATGHQVAYREYSGGHNYSAWRDDVWRGLEWLFPPFSKQAIHGHRPPPGH